MNRPSARGELLRLLGAGFGIAIAVGEMIGSGILRTPGLVAASVPVASLILLVWGFGAVHALLQANVLAELGTMLPRAGGQYVFAQRAFGDIGGLIVGWSMWCAHIAGIAASSIAFADFLAPVWPRSAGHAAAIAVALQLALFAPNVAGLREGRALQVATSVAKICLLLAFVAAAVLLVPSTPAPAPRFANGVGFLALAGAYQLVRGAYNGWHAPVYFAEENVVPARSIPRSLFFGIGLTAALYIAINAALLHAMGVSQLAANALPYLDVLERFGGRWPAALFAVGAMITAASCANANLMIAPRIVFALSRSRLLPATLQAVNGGGSPHLAFAMTAAVAIPLALSGGYRFVFGLIAILATLASVVTEAGYFVLRAREPGLARPWRARAHPLLPALVLLVDGAVLLLFVLADLRGAVLAGILCALCIPFAFVVRALRKWPGV